MKNCAEIQDKFGVLWYNDDEIFRWNDSDFEHKASEFAAAGINIVMTFSCTHFRWNYYPWFDQLNEVLARMVRACSKFNIRVVEHHSCHLTFNPRDNSEWEYAQNILKVRHSSLESFPGLKDFIASGDPEILPGVRLSSCRQIDGRTGDYARTGYKGYALCFNNPDYRKAYFAYLEKVYATGVAGIMTDDVHYFGFGHACACKHCREKFKTAYNCELPPPEAWGSFADYSNPVYVNWLKFRFDSTVEFQEAVTSHAESLNYKLLRPNYTTSTFARNQTAYPFEQAGHLWSHVFQENMFSSIMRASWPSWSCDAAHRRAMAKKYDIEAMSMFYPAREDDYYFCWALSRQWEHLLMATPEGGDLTEVEKKFYDYEQQHRRWVKSAERPAKLAFLQPRQSLDFAADAVESSCRPLNVWMQGAVFRNLPFDVIFEEDTIEHWKNYALVVIAGANMLKDRQLELIKEYCSNGGRVLIFGAFGIVDDNGLPRKHPEKLFGFSAHLHDFQSCGAGSLHFAGESIALPAVAESRWLSDVEGDAEVIAQTDDKNKILGISAMHGNLLWLAGGVRSRTPQAVHYAFTVSRWGDGKHTAVEAPAYAADYITAVPGAVLQQFLGKDFILQANTSDYQIALHSNPDQKRYRLTLVNIKDLLAVPPAKISHADIYTNFTMQKNSDQELIVVKFKLPDNNIVPHSAQAFSPEYSGSRELDLQYDSDFCTVTVPPGTFTGFLEIELM